MLSLAIALLFVATNHCEAALDPSSKLNTPTFSSVPAVDLQPLFEIDVPWLGADIATSVPLGGLPGVYLWLHGDTLIGKMSDGVRVVQGMPRNSVAILNVSSSGQPVSPYQHYIRSNPKEAQHFGFFSPPEPSQWYWPTAGISIGEDLYVVSMRIEAGGSGLFPFATAGFDVLKISVRASKSRQHAVLQKLSCVIRAEPVN